MTNKLKSDILKNFFFTSCILIGTMGVNAQNFEWVIGIGSSSSDNAAESIAVDASGNTYVTGAVYGSTDFDPGSGSAVITPSSGNNIAYIAKYGPGGNYLWAVGLESEYITGERIAVDAAGNVYVRGSFTGTVDFDPGTGTANRTANNGGIFLTKYNTNGQYLWVIVFEADYIELGYGGIAVDAAGNTSITGYFEGTLDFDPGTGSASITSEGEMFLAKYDTEGNYLWAKTVEDGTNATTDATGNIYLTGGSSSGGIPLAKYDAGGNIQWSIRIPAINVQSAAVDAPGNVYVTGEFRTTTTVDFDPGPGTATLTPAGGSDVFLAKYDPSGNYLWAKKMGGTGEDKGNGVSLDISGNVYITGYFSGTAEFNEGNSNGTLISEGNRDIFVAGYDANGNYLWARGTGSTGTASEEGRGIATYATSIYVTGNFGSTGASTDFNPGGTGGTLTTVGSNDIFILKLQNATPLPVHMSTLQGRVNGNQAHLTWYTFSEQNNKGFTVERSDNGIDFTPSGFASSLARGGNSKEQINYTYTDLLTLHQGYTFYRLRQEDRDGSISYSNVVRLQYRNAVHEISIYPNPVQEIIYIESSEPVYIELSNLDGRVLLSEQNTKSIDVKNLAQGTYLLRITDQEGRLIRTEKVIKII